MKTPVSVLSIAFLLTVCTSDASACSPVRINTSQELVMLSDGIYRVKATGLSQGVPSESFLPTLQIKFQVLETLKGPAATSLLLPGIPSQQSDFNQGSVPYTFVRSDGTHGNCFAWTYRLGWEYLLLVRSGSPYWSPLAPTTEQINGSTDPWLEWVRQSIPAAPPAA